MTVTITFRTPSSEQRENTSTIHERRLEAVPQATAEQMAEAHRSTLYRYEKPEDDILVALDFQEIVALTASEE